MKQSATLARRTLWSWFLTFDLEHLQCIACDAMKLSNKFERNRAIRGGVIAISVFDLMTLNIVLRVSLGSGIIFTKFDLRQLIRAWIIAFLMLTCYVTLWPWPLTSWPWTFIALRVSYAFRLGAKFERNRIIHRGVIDDLARFRHAILGVGQTDKVLSGTWTQLH